jgi:hypothetical protein
VSVVTRNITWIRANPTDECFYHLSRLIPLLSNKITCQPDNSPATFDHPSHNTLMQDGSLQCHVTINTLDKTRQNDVALFRTAEKLSSPAPTLWRPADLLSLNIPVHHNRQHTTPGIHQITQHAAHARTTTHGMPETTLTIKIVRHIADMDR